MDGQLRERDLYLIETSFPGGNRDFCFVHLGEDRQWQPVHAIDLLALDRGSAMIQDLASNQPALAANLALCRLLVPCLRYSGVGRHLVIERWELEDARGENLPADTRTRLARELAAEQAEQWRLITAGERPPAGSLAEAFWDAHLELPRLEAVFEDLELGRFAQRLHQYLVEPGEGAAGINWSRIRAQVERCRQSDFAPLNDGKPVRAYRAHFEKLLAVAVQWSSQLAGEIARHIVRERLAAEGAPALTEAEQRMLDFRYGACKALGNINVGFLGDTGPLLAGFVNYLYVLHATGAPEAQRMQAQQWLHRYAHLLQAYRRRRKAARAEERRENRQRRSSPAPDDEPADTRTTADAQPEPTAASIERIAELDYLEVKILPRLKPRDAARVRALVEANGDREEAARSLGMTREQFNRIWRQTTWPNLQRAIDEAAREEDEKDAG